MDKDLKKKISKIYSLLSEEQKTKDIIYIENIPGNKPIIGYLETIGSTDCQYEIISDGQIRTIQETSGSTYLWYKKLDGSWVIKLWAINGAKNDKN